MPEPHLRAGDTARAAVATILGRHMAAGRLTVDEYDERLARAYAARTYGELDQLTTDLPSSDRTRAAEPVRHGNPYPVRACGPVFGPWGWGGRTESPWRSWLGTALIVIAVWAVISIATREFLPFWPIWVIGPWGAILLARTLTGGRDDRHEQRGERYPSRR
jgi:hypothetical protein